MRLADAQHGEVVQNTANRSFYRMEGTEQGRARIRPLEVFPNGLLLEKPTDTTVAPDLEVSSCGMWAEEFTVQTDVPRKTRRTYERELDRKQEELAMLVEEAKTIPAKGRGSHANKVKAAESRVGTLLRGLEERPEGMVEEALPVRPQTKKFRMREIVQMPSGLAAMIVGYNERIDRVLEASVIARPVLDEPILCAQIPQECLRPIADRHLSTV